MRIISPLEVSAFDTATAAILDAQYASAERIVNYVRMGVMGVLAIIAITWSGALPLELNLVNLAVLAPMSVWSVGQHLLVHRNPRPEKLLQFVNPMLDISAVSGLLLGYGLFGSPDLAVKSPIWSAYFIIMAARSITGSPGRAGLSALFAVVQYAAVAWFFTSGGDLALLDNPLESVSVTGTSLMDEAAKVVLLVLAGIVVMYATAWNERTLRRAVESQRASDGRFRAIFEHAAVGIAVLDSSSRILETNGAFERFLASGREDLSGRNLTNFLTAEDVGKGGGIMRQVASDASANATAEIRFVRADGQLAWGSVTVSATEDHESRRLVAMVGDATERKTLEAQLVHQAFHDSLTGLANRVRFRERVDHALARRKDESDTIAVMFLDLDNFKTVNDTMGHAAGDILLRVVSERLLSATRGCDTVARLGGDEFAVLLEPVHVGGGPDIVAGRIVKALTKPIELGNDRTTTVGTSIGIATSQGGESPDVLLRNADLAMYEAKNRVKGSWVHYDPEMHANIVNRVTLETDLKHDVEHERLRLVYQPIMDLRTGRADLFEVLLRWAHSRRGAVPPSTFIPLAEESGLITQLGAWVLRVACCQAAEWNRNAEQPVSITVNLSGKQIQDETLADQVDGALKESGLEPAKLVLEITETVIMQETEQTLARLHELKRLGVRLAIDDFGTGYSSLSYLQQFPVDILKIDQSFTEAILRGQNDVSLVRTIVSLARNLGLWSIAEGVEAPQQHKELVDLGCDAAQGYYYGRPMEVEEVSVALGSQNPSEVLQLHSQGHSLKSA